MYLLALRLLPRLDTLTTIHGFFYGLVQYLQRTYYDSIKLKGTHSLWITKRIDESIAMHA